MNIYKENLWLSEQSDLHKAYKIKFESDKKLVYKRDQDKELYNLYIKRIYDRYCDILKSGKKSEDMTNNDLWKIFEYFTCIKLTNMYGKQFYEYDDIDPTYKEDNSMTQNDTGIDACDLDNTIVQCKLRKQSLTWGDCATFFGSQISFDEQTQKKVIQWENAIIARNAESKLSNVLKTKEKLFKDVTFSRDDIISFCDNLVKNPPKQEIVKKEKFVLRDYQIEAINLIKSSTKNVIISLPTGTGKNTVILKSMLAGKKYLVLVPRIILMEQLKEEIIKHHSNWKNLIQMIGDNNNEYDESKLITICVFNSANIVAKYKDDFEKIYVDEAHHVNTPAIYKDEESNEDVKEVVKHILILLKALRN
jgi:primosomal protein N'